MNRQTCKDCVYLNKDESNMNDSTAFLCYRFPPTVFVAQVENYGLKQIATMTFYPSLKQNSYACGEYTPHGNAVISAIK